MWSNNKKQSAYKVNWIQKFYAYISLQLCSAAKDDNYMKGTKYVFGVHLYMFC